MPTLNMGFNSDRAETGHLDNNKCAGATKQQNVESFRGVRQEESMEGA